MQTCSTRLDRSEGSSVTPHRGCYLLFNLVAIAAASFFLERKYEIKRKILEKTEKIYEQEKASSSSYR